MVNISIDVTDLGGEARPGDKVVLWKPAAAGSSSHAGRVISTAPVDVFLTNGKASVPDVEPGEMRVLLQCRGVESQGPIDVTVPDGNGTVTLRSLIESQFEYAPPIVSAVQEAAANASASERAAIEAQVRSEAAADRADAKVDDAINNGANLVRGEVKQDADRAVSARQAAVQSEANAKASESAAATSESNAATSEANAKQSETNAGDYAAVATTAATEAVDAMERATDLAGGDFATHKYVDDALTLKADKTYVDDTKWPRGAFSITTLPNMDDAPEGVVTVNTAQRSMFWGLPGGHLGFVVTYSSTLFKAQVFYGITSTGLQEYTRKYGSSGWSEWYRTDDQIELAKAYTDNTVEEAGKELVHIPLNRPWGDGSGHTRSYAKRSCRIPLNLQVPTTGGIRVGFNNVEFLSETIYTTPVVIEGVFIGKSKRGADGELTGEFDGQPIPLLDSPLTLPADGSTVFTPWGAEDMTLDRDTIISYGFQSDGVGVFLYNQGVSWQTNLHTDAGRLTPLYAESGGGSPSVSSPLGVSVELYTKAPRVLVVGDSRAVALATGKPLVGSPVAIAAASGWIPRIHAIGGSRLRQWATNTLIWDEVAQSGADRVIIILGSNDIFGAGGSTLEEIKGYFLTVVEKIRAALGEVPIFTMELYPRFITPAPELVQIMEEFNAWTYGLPGGIDGVIPIDNLIDPSTGAVHAKWMSDDNVHLSMAGNVRLAQNFQIS